MGTVGDLFFSECGHLGDVFFFGMWYGGGVLFFGMWCCFFGTCSRQSKAGHRARVNSSRPGARQPLAQLIIVKLQFVFFRYVLKKGFISFDRHV